MEAGYPKEIAYFECLHELKMIVDLMYQGGHNYMHFSVSDTAEYGSLSRRDRIIDEHVRENMRAVLKEIQDGTFAREWIAENDEGRPRFVPMREAGAECPHRGHRQGTAGHDALDGPEVGENEEQHFMQQETLSVVHHRTLVLAGLGVVDYVALRSLSDCRS